MVFGASMKDMFNTANLFKLRTKEGAEHFHIHRYLGTLVLANYLYRVLLRLTNGKPFGDDEASWEVLAVIILHAALSTTSLFFHIPKKRNKANPMIWPEFRYHSMVFAYRTLLATCGSLWVWGRSGGGSRHPAAYALVLGTCAAADLVTRRFGDADKRTTNAMPCARAGLAPGTCDLSPCHLPRGP